ncbi:IclR family transcriptional regulator [Psychromarinibacter sp. C21-152]|uniref:IclR family transcriptional regulator n=1 Tax=Psychromarinibacter sediminicola TaxID=3033385 RepID=A0AAE3NNS8_9RHOB|nr:IclR family transcriptional regulator [Psychromarinibacter sediminicola]MDF0599296.1 IclR family transcriptional regulator [Psychromarinibacter sediminicola]
MDGSDRTGDGPAYKVNVLDRAISVLQAFSVGAPHMTLAQLSRATGLHRSTVLRLLSTLAHSGLVIRDDETGQYSLGYELIAMAEVAKAGSGIADWARPVMKEIRDRLNETVALSVRSGDYRVDIDQLVANQPIRRVIAMGEHKLLTFGAPSLAIMSALPEAEAEAIVERLMPKTREAFPDFDIGAFRAQLQKVRERGYHEQHFQFGPGSWSGSVGFAGPVFGRRGEVVAAMGVSVPSGRMNDELRARAIAEVVEGCAAIGARLGRGGSAA